MLDCWVQNISVPIPVLHVGQNWECTEDDLIQFLTNKKALPQGRFERKKERKRRNQEEYESVGRK